MRILFGRTLLFQSAVVATVYIVLVTYLPNMSLVWRTLTETHPTSYRIAIYLGLLGGLWTNNTPQGLLILTTTSFLTGINMVLVFKRFTILRQNGGRFTVGVGSLLGVISHGCSACGLPILVLLGLGGSLSFLPLRGTELSYLSLLLIFGTFLLLLRSTNNLNNLGSQCSLNMEPKKREGVIIRNKILA